MKSESIIWSHEDDDKSIGSIAGSIDSSTLDIAIICVTNDMVTPQYDFWYDQEWDETRFLNILGGGQTNKVNSDCE